MIRIGLSEKQKQWTVSEYLDRHEIDKVFCFYFKAFPLQLSTDCEIEYIEYADIIEYEPFYRLLEEISKDSLIVINECLRTQKRSDLTYNCAHHYLGQTPHRIIFEYFPIIESRGDFMILLDFEDKGKYRGKGFDYSFLQDEDIQIRPRRINMEVLPVEITEKDRARYERKKDALFDNLGDKDPDTIPRALQLLAGDIKKKAIEADKTYAARNKRFKLENVFSYQEITGRGDYVIIDTHYRRLNFNDFLKTTGMSKVKYLSTMLPIDSYITAEFAKWKARVEAIYDKASIYQ